MTKQAKKAMRFRVVAALLACHWRSNLEIACEARCSETSVRNVRHTLEKKRMITRWHSHRQADPKRLREARRLLEREPWLSSRWIAEKKGVAISTVLLLRRKLEERGIIQRRGIPRGRHSRALQQKGAGHGKANDERPGQKAVPERHDHRPLV